MQNTREEPKTPRQLFEEGEQLLETLLKGVTTSDNLKEHDSGAVMVYSAALIGKTYGILSQSYVRRAIQLIERTRAVLRDYVKSTHNDIAYLFVTFQDERLQHLHKLLR